MLLYFTARWSWI